jgi:hypothetical protein
MSLPKIKINFWLIIILVLMVYLPVFANGFVWDDEEQIVANSTIKNISNIPTLFLSSTFNSGGAVSMGGLYYKPLMPLSFTLLYSLFGNSPWGYHLFQLVLHVATCFVLYKLLRSLLENESLGQPTKTQNAATNNTIALAITAIFAIHPGNVESIVYMSSLQEILYSFFGLSSFLLLIRSLRNQIINYKLITLSLVLLFFALLGKESGIAYFPIIFFYLLLFNKKVLPIWSLGSFLVIVFYLVLRLGIANVGFSSKTLSPISQQPFLIRLTTLPFEIMSYLRITYFPKDLFIAQHQVVDSIKDPRFLVGILITGLFLIAVFGIISKTKSKLLLFFFLWFSASISIALNIFPLDMTIAERWLYTPIIGLIGLTLLFISKTIPWKIKGASIIFILIIGILGARSFSRVRNWKDGLTLYNHDILYNPNSFDLQNNLGTELFRAGEHDKALVHFQKSLDLSPNWHIPLNNIGVYYERKQDFQKAKDYYLKAIENGNYYLAYENYAKLHYHNIKTENDRKELEQFINESLLIFPYNQTLKSILYNLESDQN